MAAFAIPLALFPVASKVSWISSSAEQDKFKILSIPGSMVAGKNGHAMPKLNTTLGAESLQKRTRPRKQPDVNVITDYLCFGQIDEEDTFHQCFPVRSHEAGADGTTSIQWLMNSLQDACLNSSRRAGMISDGFRSEALSRHNLIWAVTKMHVVVNRYPSWGDVVQIGTWIYPNGKNGICRDWNVRNINTGEILAQATSSWVLMNTRTRRLSKMPDDVRVELEKFLHDRVPIIDEDRRELPKLDKSTADNVQNDLTPQWIDLDVQQHVNNVKYIDWILESCISMLESHELVGLTLEYRKECRIGDVLQSMTAAAKDCVDENQPECVHLLCLDNGTPLMRGRTTWRPKQINMQKHVSRLLAQNM